MRIRKIYDFENAHIVRLCSSKRCKTSLHGHSYRCEVILESNYLDRAGMVYDFGLMGLGVRTIIDSFDHATTIFKDDDKDYINDIKKHSQRWISIPFNPSAEQFSRIFFVLIDRLFELSKFKNGEREIKLYSIIVHETKSGYAQCFREDAYSHLMGNINLCDIEFSKAIVDEWSDKEFFNKLKEGSEFEFPDEC
ncbi:6-carboxytetrahydropterin synthase [uncultured Campylobacter sp.]|uniref:6-pyruvoyl trahydropterin synthase family protein n=1 Tax=uncultured Campylobacter sp. TaxID=218934 RepID=UPI0026180CB1|nr:6-carboxytetrahydropterin synthase [uncultured Campylobacter sp.]